MKRIGISTLILVTWTSLLAAKPPGPLPALNDAVHAITLDGGKAYAATENQRGITVLMESTASGWQPLPGQLNGRVYALEVMNGALYVGGEFTLDQGGRSLKNLARWQAGSWADLDGGIQGAVFDLASDGQALFVGGAFQSAGNILPERDPCGDLLVTSTHGIAKWDGNGWSPLAQGVDGLVNTIVPHQGLLYVGGRFDHAGDAPAANVAVFDGANWQRLGEGIPGSVYSLAIDEHGSLYSGGTFPGAREEDIGNIRMFDGRHWSSLGSGIDGSIHALGFHQGQLIAGGLIQPTDQQSLSHVAIFDGRSWRPTANGLQGNLRAMLPVEGGTILACECADGGLVFWPD